MKPPAPLDDGRLATTPQFRHIVTVESTEPPNPAASDAMLTLLSEQGFVEVLDQADGRLQVAGPNPARADQLAFMLRDKLGEISSRP